MDLEAFMRRACADVLNGGGAEQPEWLRLAIAERLKAREEAARSAEAAPPPGDAPETGAA
jgi:hypothetical protein